MRLTRNVAISPAVQRHTVEPDSRMSPISIVILRLRMGGRKIMPKLLICWVTLSDC